MWGGPAKIKDIKRYPSVEVCVSAKLIPAGPRKSSLYVRLSLYPVSLYRGLTVVALGARLERTKLRHGVNFRFQHAQNQVRTELCHPQYCSSMSYSLLISTNQIVGITGVHTKE